MTLLAWDGVILASDSLIVYYDCGTEVGRTNIDKIFPSNATINGEKIYAITGAGFVPVIEAAIDCIEKGIIDFRADQSVNDAINRCIATMPSEMYSNTGILAVGENSIFHFDIKFNGHEPAVGSLNAYDKKKNAIWAGSGYDALKDKGYVVGSLNSLNVIEAGIKYDSFTGGDFVQIYIDSQKRITAYKRNSFIYKAIRFIYGLLYR
jgi:hypothetical protein